MGISVWNPEMADISTHIDRVRRISDEARQMGVNEKGLCQLLM